MALNTTNWQLMDGSGRRRWFYKSVDFPIDMLAANYFDGASGWLIVGDIIHAVCVDDLGTFAESVVSRSDFQVTANAGGAVTVVGAT